MANSYRNTFVAVWGLGFALVFASIFIWVAASRMQTIASAVIWSVLGAQMLFIAFLMHTQKSQIYYRIGKGFLMGFCGVHTQKTLLLECQDDIIPFCQRSDVTPIVVGNAWSNWLGYKTYYRPLILTHMFEGTIDGHKWRAGTSISKVQEHYIKNGRLLKNTPSTGNITIGAWFSSESHGNNGSEVSDFLPSAVLHTIDLETFTSLSMSTARFVQQSKTQKMIIVSVEFADAAFISDVRVTRQVRPCRYASDLDAFLGRKTLIRYMFVGYRQILGVSWGVDRGDKVLTGSRLNLKWIRLFILAGLGWGQIEFGDADDVSESLSSAMFALPDTVIPIMAWYGSLIGILNFEIAIPTMRSTAMWQFIQSLQKEVITPLGGRCEIRFIDNVICLDFAAYMSSISTVLERLSRVGVTKCYLHKGKFDVSTFTSKIQFIPFDQLKNV